MNTMLRTSVMGSGLVLLAGGWWSYSSLYLAPVMQAKEELVSVENQLEALRNQRTGFNTRALELDGFAERTIARDAESAQAELRRVLNEIAEISGLARVRTTSDVRRVAITPPSTGRINEFRRQVGGRVRSVEQVSFVPVTGSLNGRGDFASALEAIALLESQTFPIRFTSLSLAPTDALGNVELAVAMETMVLPDLPAGRAEAYTVVGALPEAEAAARRVLARSPFVAPAPPSPPPPPPPTVSPPPPPPPPPGPPPPPPPPHYERWTLTGITATQDGPIVWLRNNQDGRTRYVAEGETLFGLTFEHVGPLDTLIRLDEKRYQLLVGDTLDRRDRPVFEGSPPR